MTAIEILLQHRERIQVPNIRLECGDPTGDAPSCGDFVAHAVTAVSPASSGRARGRGERSAPQPRPGSATLRGIAM